MTKMVITKLASTFLMNFLVLEDEHADNSGLKASIKVCLHRQFSYVFILLSVIFTASRTFSKKPWFKLISWSWILNNALFLDFVIHGKDLVLDKCKGTTQLRLLPFEHYIYFGLYYTI